MRKSVILVLFIAFLLSIFSASVYAYSFSISHSKDSSTYYTGRSGKLINIQVKNSGSDPIRINTVGAHFEWQETGYWSSSTVSPVVEIAPGETKSLPDVSVSVPNGKASGDYTYQVGITFEEEDCGIFSCSWKNRGTVYQSSMPSLYVKNWDEYIGEQESESDAETAITSAQDAINKASASITNAQTAINSAKNSGADVSDAEVKLTNAKTSHQSAQSKLSSANSLFNSGSHESAASAANEATDLANSAKLDADSAKTFAEQSKIGTLSARSDTQDGLNNAQAAISSARSAITSAKSAITDAWSIGADTSSAQTTLDSANSKISTADSKLDEADVQFSNKKYDNAKQSASQAESFATDAKLEAESAESIAIQAKQSYEKEQEEALLKLEGEEREAALKLENLKGQASKKLSSAQSTYNSIIESSEQSSKMMDRLSDMGVDSSGYKSDLKKATDTFLNAKAELDKAKSRFDSGEYENSLTYSEKSLDISESDNTIIQNLQYNMVNDGKGIVDKLKSSVGSNYDSTLKTLESAKSEMTADIYMSKAKELDDVKNTLDLAAAKISSAESNLNSKNYYDALNDYRGAYSELKKAESFSTKIGAAVVEEQKGICGPTGILLLILIPALGVNAVKKYRVPT